MVTVADVEMAQQAWGNGVVEIAAAHNAGLDYVQRAHAHVETLFGVIDPVSCVFELITQPSYLIQRQTRTNKTIQQSLERNC